MATTNDTSLKLAAVVSAALKEAGISQRDMPALTGISINTLSRRLTGHSAFKVPELDILAGVLGVKVSELFQKAEAA